MAKITGYENYEYHIPAEGGSPARDFVGYRIHISYPIKPTEGQGIATQTFRISVEEFPYIFTGYAAKDLAGLLGREMRYEVVPVGKRYDLARVTFED